MARPSSSRVAALAAVAAAVTVATVPPAAAQPTTPVATPSVPSTRVSYPPTKTIDQADDYHGTRVADPFRWLEDLDGAATADWVKAQNAVTFAYLAGLPGRDAIKTRLTEMWNYPRVGLPFREGGRLFFTKNTGLQRQSPWYAASGRTSDGAALVIDPNAISADGSTSLSRFAPDPSGRYVAYGLSEGGADWVTIRVKRLDPSTGSGQPGADLSDVVQWVRYSGVSWTRDGEGFFYTRYPEPPKEAGKTLSNASRDPRAYYHRLGTPQSADVMVFSYPKEPTWGVGAYTSEDGRWLFATVGRGTDPENHLYVADLGDPMRPNVGAPLVPVDTTMAAAFSTIGVRGTTLYLLTNLDAPKYRIVSVDLARPGRANWKTIVPESTNALESAALVGGRLVAQYLADVKSEVLLFDPAGKRLGTLPLPGIGAVAGLTGREDEPELFYGFSSFLAPFSVYRYDVSTGKQETFFAPNVPFDASAYETEQVFYTSKDGTRVPMFIVHRKGLVKDGSHPAMLYSYGGFNISMTPGFSPSTAAWLEMGGIYAQPALRGGGEYGEAWHQAGKLDRKQNVFDDFLAAAQYLVDHRYTSPAKLAIRGGSNGGLLVGAAMTQRPDLFAVAIPQVGVMDMLRYHKFSAGVFWVPEYGSADDPQQFQTLMKYSPLQNLKPGTCYPATLVTTADHDDRVVPGHSFKFAAALQAAQQAAPGCDRPALIRIEAQGSHGYRPLDKAIAEQADLWAFAARNLGMAVRFPRGRAMQ